MTEVKNSDMRIYHSVMSRMFEPDIRANNAPLNFAIPANMLELSFIGMVVPDFYVCELCGAVHSFLNLSYVGCYVCDDCKKEVTRCGICGENMIDVSDYPQNHIGRDMKKKYNRTVRINGVEKYVCNSCKTTRLHTCSQCKTVFSGLCAITNGKHYCPECTAEYLKKCTHCNEYKDKNTLINGVCPDCFARLNSFPIAEIQSYGTKPRPVFLSLVSAGILPYYGVELEIDGGNRTDSLLRNLAKFKEIYLKSDGSLSRAGIEIVTYPMNLDYHARIMQWSAIFTACESAGYKSHNTSNCGLHIHVNRGAFGESKRNQQKYIAFFLYLFMKFAPQIKKFSRRENFGYCDFIPYRLTEKVTRSYQSYQSYNRTVRNLAVNFRNENTVEIRVFRGTLDLTSFLAAIALIDTLIKLALSAKTEESLRTIEWDAVKRNATLPQLVTYLNKKGL